MNKFPEHIFKSLYSKFQDYKFKTISSSFRQAVVFLPLFYYNNELQILFTKRTSTLSKHKGEISFPGGSRDLTDNELIDCGYRECYEEIGIKREDLNVLGRLDDMATNSQYLLTPFVTTIPYPYHFVINKNEVEHLIKVPIKNLLDRTSYNMVDDFLFHGKKHRVHFFYYKEFTIWGITGSILHNFLEVAFDF